MKMAKRGSQVSNDGFLKKVTRTKNLMVRNLAI